MLCELWDLRCVAFLSKIFGLLQMDSSQFLNTSQGKQDAAYHSSDCCSFRFCTGDDKICFLNFISESAAERTLFGMLYHLMYNIKVHFFIFF